MNFHRFVATLAFLMCESSGAFAAVGDPQIRTDHPWYPGELAFSTFERLFATEAEQFKRATGRAPASEEDKAIAAWQWRNTHYWHGEEGAEDLWGRGFTSGGDMRTREYWTGFFAHGFGLCGTTHSQWTAEMESLFGHGRGRGVGVEGHNAFEVYLTGGDYGPGKWVLLDHDLSTIIYRQDRKAVMGIRDIGANLRHFIDRWFAPEKQHGWLVCGLHPNDGAAYSQYNTAEYLPGYAGPPPVVQLRRGEILRRYPAPGLDDGHTFVFWGRNYGIAGIPGPERSITWVNQPEKMHGSKDGAGHHAGQARFANATYAYKPDFASGGYKEGVIAEGNEFVTFEFYSPYIIGATPPNDSAWGIYDKGGRNGLIVTGNATCAVSVSVDQGATWSDGGKLTGALDLTDLVKGRRQYWIKFGAGPARLSKAGIAIRTVCQANSSIVPRLGDNGSRVEFAASGLGIISAGPNRPQAAAHIVEGGFDTPSVTLELASPRGESVSTIHAAAHVASGNPPSPDVRYQVEYSIDAGRTWKPITRDWTIPRRGDEPRDFWSQSLCYGSATLDTSVAGPIRVRFRNNGGKKYLRAEAHLLYRVAQASPLRVTFDWKDDKGGHRESHEVTASKAVWDLKTGKGVETRWVEFAVP